ncbi:hypothetical conserved protein [Methylocaldum marinum]|uniref:Hypothetical conserved protein n=1 Tax=Methylocaldum marinum TaxID=1432792 RepID=A0A250KSI3_9GAMM|nr:hypothetical protein [Methylocaldum marinum]BBA32739.1 hypothetical conserved protein [Methylocaldum marinum]
MATYEIAAPKVSTRCVALVFLLFLTQSGATGAGQTRPFYMGFTPWPWNSSTSAVVDTYNFINNHADLISHHIEEGVPWVEAVEGKPFPPEMVSGWELRKNTTKKDMKVFLSLTPLNQERNGMALNRGAAYQTPLPESFRNLSLDDPKVKVAYLNYVKRAVDFFHPDYLAITVEANELLENNPALWPAFVNLYQYVYAQLKAIYPQLPVFFTVSLHNLENPTRGNVDDRWRKIGELWSHSDLIGVSFYPFLQYPLDLSDPLRSLAKVKSAANKPIAITEAGYPAQPSIIRSLASLPATPEIQRDIYYGLLKAASEDSYKFVVMWSYRDYDKLWNAIKDQTPEWGALWKDVGMLDENANKRPSFDVWNLFYSMPKQ